MKSDMEIKSIPLKDACEFIKDGDWIETKDQGGNDYRLLQINNVGLGEFVEKGKYRWITEETFQRLRCTEIMLGDVLVARMPDPTGRAWYVDELPWKAITAVDVAIIRAKKGVLDARYCAYFLNSPRTLALVQSLESGTTRKRIRRSDLENIEIPLPSIDIQERIADVLYEIDKKIKLNRQISKTLEQIAQAIFKSWFVDFEPVKAKIEAKQNGQDTERAAMQAISGKTNEQLDQLSPDQLQQLTVTATLFPDELVDSEFGEIPTGWEMKESSSLFEVKDGTHDSPKQAVEGFPLVTSRHITTGVIDFTKTYLISAEDFEQINKRSKVDSMDILLTMIGTVGESLLVQQENINFAIKNVGLFKTSQNPSFAVYFYLLLRSPRMKQYLESRMAGTTQKYLTLKALRSIPVVHPGEVVLKEFNTLVSSMYSLVDNNNEQINNLVNIRDALLPKLLTGKVEL